MIVIFFVPPFLILGSLGISVVDTLSRQKLENLILEQCSYFIRGENPCQEHLVLVDSCHQNKEDPCFQAMRWQFPCRLHPDT